MIATVLLQRALGLPDFGGGFWLLWALVIIASVGLASASWYALESPLLRLMARSPSGASAQGGGSNPAPRE